MSHRNRRAILVEQLEHRTLLSAAPPLDVKFPGIDAPTDTQMMGVFAPPPDCALAVGPSNVVTVVNTVVSIYSTAGVLQSEQTINEFFGLGPPQNTFDAPRLTDPQIFYDPNSSRFVMTITAWDNNVPQPWSKVYIAASKTSNPADGWFPTFIDTTHLVTANDENGNPQTVTEFLDQPVFAVTGDNVYICGTNGWVAGNKGYAASSEILIIPKLPLYSSGVATASFIDTQYTGLSAVQPYDDLPSGIGEYLLAGSALYVLGPGTANPSLTFVGSLLPAINGDIVSVAPASPLKGSNISIGENSSRRPVYRNGKIYSAITVGGLGNNGGSFPGATANDKTDPTVMWFEYRAPTSGAQTTLANWTLADWGVEGGEDISSHTRTGYPEVAVDSFGDLALGFSATGNNLYAGAYYAVHLATDPPHALSASGVLQEGLGTYGDPGNTALYASSPNAYFERWGDYSGMAVAPDGSFWAFNEYANMPRSGIANDMNWATAVGQFHVPTPTPVDRTVITGTDQNDHFTVSYDESNEDFQWYYFVTNRDDNGNIVAQWQLPSDPVEIDGLGGNDVLTIESTEFVSAVPNGWSFDGGTGTNTLVLEQGNNQAVHVNALGLSQGNETIFDSNVQSIQAEGSPGDDTLIVDASLGSIAAPGGVSFDGAGGNNIVRVLGSTSADVISVNGSTSNTGQITTQVFTSTSSVTYSNTAEIDYINGGGGHDSLTVSGATPVSLPAVAGSGFNPLFFSNLSIAAGAKLLTQASDAYVDRTVLVIDSGGFSLDPAGTLDLANNSMIVNDATAGHAATVASINGLIDAAAQTDPTTYNPRWTGTGITSSLLVGASGVDIYHSVGVADNATLRELQKTTFAGQVVDINSIFVGYVLTGDSNLDGKADFSDFLNLQTNYHHPGTWQTGDFNHDGYVDINDYNVFNHNYGQSL